MNRAVQLWVGRERRRMARAGTVGRRGARRVAFKDAHVSLTNRMADVPDGLDVPAFNVSIERVLGRAWLNTFYSFAGLRKDGGS